LMVGVVSIHKGVQRRGIDQDGHEW
jgi:hypothetical protein